MPLEVREVIRKGGWYGHRVTIAFPEPRWGIAIVSGRLGDDVRPGTYRAIPRQTGIEEDKT